MGVVALSYSNLSTMFCMKKLKRKKDEEDESALGFGDRLF